MKTIKNLNFINSMNNKTFLKNIFKVSLGISLITPFFKNEPARAFITACADTDTVADLSGEANPCYITPEMMKVTFYEIGFCTSDPLATGTFVDTTCSKTWDNASGFESDIGQQTYEDMIGTTYRIPNASYTHAYGIMNNSWTYKGKYKLTHSGGTTYYTNSTNGLVTTNSSEYGEWNDDISDMQGEETTGLCYDYSASTVGGEVTAVLANSSLQTATDSTSCNNATRVIGSVALTSSLTMDDTVKGYQLNWRISNMGIGISDNGNANNLPYDWYGGPFTPIFTLIK